MIILQCPNFRSSSFTFSIPSLPKFTGKNKCRYYFLHNCFNFDFPIRNPEEIADFTIFLTFLTIIIRDITINITQNPHKIIGSMLNTV